jgi:hypothetical protein
MALFKQLSLMLVLLLAAACNYPNSLAPAQQQTVRVVDAESGAPIPGAQLDLHYFPSAPQAPDPNHPQFSADDQGQITLSVRPAAAIWQVRAEGFIEQQLSAEDGHLPPRYAAHGDEEVDGVVHLYRQPEPTLIVELSEMYTGTLTINLQPAPGFDFVSTDEINVAFAAVDPAASYVQEAPGVRTFTVTASDQGVADLVVTPLLYDITERHVQVQDSSGVLPWRDVADEDKSGRGVWGSVSTVDKAQGQIQLFVGDWEAYQQETNTTE